ncbi:hypothetical protein ASC86_18705 [Rhizobium sp. Root1212]|nr:hypothetical protein ASC86_18705 [Rhizobium sp. Root1212]
MGTIHGYNGIAFYGEDTYAENLGKITAANIGIYANATKMGIRNEGTIHAKTGIYLDFTELAGGYVTNAGLIEADNGIVSKKANASIFIEAKGVIDAKLVGVELTSNDGADNNHVKNEGSIQSDGIAIKGGIGGDWIENHGTIKGVISLGDGSDTFDNRGGTIDHAVDGGTGDDFYIFGAKPFAIIDSSGNDTIGTEITRTLADFLDMENLRLLGDGNINGTGNALSNHVMGNGGNNTLDGGIDNIMDILDGGDGNDTYILRDGNDLVYDFGGAAGDSNAGTDTITSTISRNLVDYKLIENLKLLGTGNLNGTGNDLANVITGTSGNNILDGGLENDDVIDTLNGGAGNDTYVLGTGHDKVVDSGGIDTITSEINRSLGDYPAIENLTLLGKGNINGTGNALVNVLTGNEGDNVLDGGNDTVVDTLKGGAGNDTYVLGAGADKIVETTGTDTIASTITRSLATYAAIENLTLKGTADIKGTGNALVNIITGNGGDNILDGGADNVVDTLNGGAGNDTYVLGSGNDKVIDSAGNDMIISSISRSLVSYSTIENLTLTGSGDINAAGNGLNNVLTGNAGMNTLDGGAGNDTYVLGSGNDKVVDASGVDTITSLISRNLSTYATIENLKLLGVSNINVTGNALANTLTGNSGLNTLFGGAGNDALIGGAGADKLDGGANIDTASYAGASAGVVASLANAAANTGDAKGDSYISIENLTGTSHKDTLAGNNGANVLVGGIGADQLTGGAGADVFLFKGVEETTVATAGQDTIYDFSQSQGDRIGLTGIDANAALTGDQGFLFKGTAAFSGTNGELRFEKQASDTYIYGDVNGDKVADFIIHLDDAVTLTAGDFLL